MNLYRNLKPFLITILAVYMTFMAYTLSAWSQIGFSGTAGYIFAFSVVALAGATWVWTAYEFYVWKSKLPLSFPDLVLEMIDDVMAVDFKSAAEDFIHQTCEMWKSFLDEQIERLDRDYLIGDLNIGWFLVQLMIYVALAATLKYGYAFSYGSTALSFLMAGLVFALPALSAVITVVWWEARKYVKKHGLVGHKHNRRHA